jgi:O-antigen/teichoic acid export membrane protein
LTPADPGLESAGPPARLSTVLDVGSSGPPQAGSPSSEIHATRAPSGQRLTRHTLLNVAGEGLPIGVAVAAIPILVAALGIERFGVLTLAWLVVGYLGFFDLGLSRAVTKLMAERMGTGDEHEIPGVAWTSLVAILALGTVGGAALALASPWIVNDALHLPPGLRGETQAAFYLLATALPTVVMLPALRGILEAQQRFGLINAVRLPMGVFTYLGPVLVLPASHSIAAVVAVLVGVRLAGWLAYLLLCLKTLPVLRRSWSFERDLLMSLMRYGGWITVSNVAGGLILVLDRLLVGALLSVAAVAYYTTPYEAALKLLVVSSALLAVLFPAFAAARDSNAITFLYAKGLRYLLIVVFPIVLVVIALAPELLRVWLGAEFAAKSAGLLRLFAVAILVNSLATVPFVLLQARGRADVSAKLHLAQIPVYLVLLWWMIRQFGLEGAATASLLRGCVSATLLFPIAHRLVPGSVRAVRPLLPFAPPVAVALAVAWLAPSPLGALFTAPALVLFAVVVWSRLLISQERTVLADWLGRLARRPQPPTSGPARVRPSR